MAAADSVRHSQWSTIADSAPDADGGDASGAASPE
jgi:hypothetical protein